MKKIIFIICILIFSIKSYSQNENIIQVISNGNGITRSDAINTALRNSIESTFGVFVSVSTEVNNDQLVKDQISTVASGNIIKYEVISENNKGQHYDITLKAEISLQKIINEINKTNKIIELSGSVFAQNVKIENYYKEQEAVIISDFLNKYQKIQMFDIDFIVQKPQPLRLIEKEYYNNGRMCNPYDDNQNYTIADSIKSKYSKNYENLFNYYDFTKYQKSSRYFKVLLKNFKGCDYFLNLNYYINDKIPSNDKYREIFNYDRKEFYDSNIFFIDLITVPRFNKNYIQFVDELTRLLSNLSIPAENNNVNSQIEKPIVISIRLIPNNGAIENFFIGSYNLGLAPNSEDLEKYTNQLEYRFHLRNKKTAYLIERFFSTYLTAQSKGCGFYNNNDLITFDFCNSNYIRDYNDKSYPQNSPDYDMPFPGFFSKQGNTNNIKINISPFFSPKGDYCPSSFHPFIFRIYKTIDEIDKINTIKFTTIN